ncbi:ATP-binding protein [Ancylomarina salipaludis]|uniref:ATP-binding protein n=1 Tax=Ancylomarina salipaludis TaxID=2501299 RepID=A0A4Q1JJT2_9BACT|nr:AAA domain-containing protein [Ancylomarina salipaludis]RXQ89489.1 ATP-binding protein [Ancylomarina salipaludis]
MTEYKKILSCWHKLEHFSPAALPKGNNIAELTDSEPWRIPLRSSDKKKTIEYTIFLGVFDSLNATNFIKGYFKDKEKDENERNTKVCFASLKLDIDGYYINDSLGISTLPWALGQLEKGEVKSDDWSRKFENIKQKVIVDFDYVFNDPLAKESGGVCRSKPSVSYLQLKNIQSKIETLCGWSVKPNKSIYIKRDEKFISKKESINNSATTDILNSFYTKDLESILAKFKPGDSPKAFLDYLNGSLGKSSKRIDLSKDTEALKTSLTPINYPDGCWPSEYTLSLMQQFAVNNIFNSLSESNQEGIFSVNGPPGTGKTTLLRDIVAPIVVKRAKALSKIENPSDAFTKVGQVGINENFSAFVYAPATELTNAGMVVASSNNGAVENISKELPLKKEASPFSHQISYFKKVAENCINEDNWGLISAVLGNKQNRNDLVSNLWFNKDFTDLQKTLKLNKVDDSSEWDNIVSVFNLKLDAVAQEKLRLEKFKIEYEDYEETLRLKNQFEREVKEYQLKCTTASGELKKEQNTVDRLKQSKNEALNELTIIQSNKPNFFVYWFNKRIRKEYQSSLQTILNEYNSISSELREQKVALHEVDVLFNELKAVYDKFSNELLKTEKVFEILECKTLQAREELKQNYADNEFWANVESKNSQQSCPWYSDNLKKLQSELFILALKLNEQFILNANSTSSRISTTLAGFFEYLKGNTNASKEEVKAMWDTFFMVIPVISTTFASVQTMFKDLDKEDIPWLFIDEAGQAIPQAAAGAIWRSKRVAVVGDPFQIEPVVTVPSALTNNISKYFDLNKSQISTELSVQSMADRINPWGSFLNINGEDVWIGIPLRVHRRCLSPMFDISNQIAYDNTMFSATAMPKSIRVNFESSFIHCEGSVEGRHFVEEQASVIKDLLIREIEAVHQLPDIFVITPFSEISYKLNSYLFKPLINEIKKYDENMDSHIMGDWLKTHIGTVHTFQGKQAEGVILCLGLDQKSKGAARWASMKPNLLNVAITRAKFRFIAIGDENIWLKQAYFRELKKMKLSVENHCVQ